ncbi:hypothetical protein NQZ68_001004 [Dissostichus eleginoides]|nr:hypothetical protein NQZ68_001004 [Dissostichus eleginoides]
MSCLSALFNFKAWDPETEGLGQHERTGEEDDQTEQGEGGEMGETEGNTEMQEMETEGDIETQTDRLASERLERGEVEGQKDSEEEFGLVVAGEMEAGKEKEQAEEVEKGEFEAEKKATNRAVKKCWSIGCPALHAKDLASILGTANEYQHDSVLNVRRCVVNDEVLLMN